MWRVVKDSECFVIEGMDVLMCEVELSKAPSFKRSRRFNIAETYM